MRRVILESPYAGNVEENVAYARAAVRELWGAIRARRDLGRGEVREVFMAPSGGSARDAKSDETDAMVRMWCEVLRLRG